MPAHRVAQNPLSSRDQRWIFLRDQIQRDSLKTNADGFTLASGRKSEFLFQLRQTTLHPWASATVADIIVDYMQFASISCVGGLALGAVPIVSAIAVMSNQKGTPIDAFFVRKEAKGHGAQERIDGFVADSGEILLVDDVATSGGSILKAFQGLAAEKANSLVRRALVIVDREEGAKENLMQQGIELLSIFKKSDFKISDR